MLHNALVGMRGNISLKKRYEDVSFNVVSVTRGCVGFKFPEKNTFRNT